MPGIQRAAVWSTTVVLALIGIAAVVRRGLILLFGIGTNPGASVLDQGFFQHPALTFVHIIPGFLFMTLSPLQFVSAIRTRRPQVHRWSGRVFAASGVVLGMSALAMGFTMAIGGANETAATTLFALAFLVSLTRAVVHARNGRIDLHREWMIRAFGIGLGVATTRPIVGLFFATGRLQPQEFFGIAFWLGFTLTLAAAEIWINITRYQAGAAPAWQD